MTAFARLVEGGPATDAICPPCEWIEHHPRTEPAKHAVRTHNRDRHAYPEQTLGITIEERSDDR